MIAVGAVIEGLIEPTCEILGHRSPHHLKMMWILSLPLLLLIPVSPAFILGVIWGHWMAIGKSMALKVLPTVRHGSIYMVLSGLLCSLDPILLWKGWWWGPALMPIISSVFLLFVETRKGEICFREVILVTMKSFGSSSLSRFLWSLLIVKMPLLLAAEKVVKGLAGIPAGVVKVSASIEVAQLKVTKQIAAILSIITVVIDWRTIFSILYRWRKANMDRELLFDSFSNRVMLKSAIECCILGFALIEGGQAATVFISLQAAQLVVWVKLK